MRSFSTRFMCLVLSCILALSVAPTVSYAREKVYCSNCGNMGEIVIMTGQTLYYNMASGNHCKWTGTIEKYTCCGKKEVKKRDSEVYENHSFNSKGVCVCGAKGTPSGPAPATPAPATPAPTAVPNACSHQTREQVLGCCRG